MDFDLCLVNNFLLPIWRKKSEKKPFFCSGKCRDQCLSSCSFWLPWQTMLETRTCSSFRVVSVCWTVIVMNVTNNCVIPQGDLGVFYARFSFAPSWTLISPKAQYTSTYTGYSWIPSLKTEAHPPPSQWLGKSFFVFVSLSFLWFCSLFFLLLLWFFRSLSFSFDQDSLLTFVEFAATGSGTQSGAQFRMQPGLKASGGAYYSAWGIFSFTITGYEPATPWYYSFHYSSSYENYGPIDNSFCICNGCDSSSITLAVAPCRLGYFSDSEGPALNSPSTDTRAKSLFNEDIVLYSYAISGFLFGILMNILSHWELLKSLIKEIQITQLRIELQLNQLVLHPLVLD